MRVVVGRVGRAHGLHGDVSITLRTDDPDLRFQVGSVLYPSQVQGVSTPPTLEVIGSRWHSGRLLVRFAQCPDRSAVEALAGTTLEAEVDVAAPGVDPEEFHDLALIGLAANRPDGSRVGQVVSVLHLPGQDLLEIGGPDGPGEPILVPFVRALVPIVDVLGGAVVVDLPPGLVEQPKPTEASASQPSAVQPSASQPSASQPSAGHDGTQSEGRPGDLGSAASGLTA